MSHTTGSSSNPAPNPLTNSSSVKGNDNQMFLVSNLLSGNENYMQWKFSIQLALGAKKKTGFIDGTSTKPASEGNELDEWITSTKT